MTSQSTRRLAALLHDARAILTPAWTRIHESDLAWRRSRAMPPTPSTAMCRHASAFLKRVMLDADRMSGTSPRSRNALSMRWRVVGGDADVDRLPSAPSYMRGDPRHFVVMDPNGHVIDLTADQFGRDPSTIAHWTTIFDDEPEPCDPGLAGSAREWARHPAYARLVSDASALRR